MKPDIALAAIRAGYSTARVRKCDRLLGSAPIRVGLAAARGRSDQAAAGSGGETDLGLQTI